MSFWTEFAHALENDDGCSNLPDILLAQAADREARLLAIVRHYRRERDAASRRVVACDECAARAWAVKP